MMGNVNIDEILRENVRRNHSRVVDYDPIRGVGCLGVRREVDSPDSHLPELVPEAMLDDRCYIAASGDAVGWVKLRSLYDFEYWAAKCVKIKDKLTGRDVPFVLNRPQRRVLGVLEEQRLAGRPLRLIMLKARQWGGSTLVQMYMAWIQCTQCRNWHSLICAHVKDTAASIRGMYTKMLACYPQDYWAEESPPQFRPYERSINTRVISGRDCRVTVGSSEGQEAVRGSDYAMAHLSEVAFWPDTAMRSPEGFIRAVCGGIARAPLTLIVLESTANGVGNYFHAEWLRSVRGESDKAAVFMPWTEIDIYADQVRDAAALWEAMDDYERKLWDDGCTLEQIQWYHDKRREYPSRELMAAEYPLDDVEAFANTGYGVFGIDLVSRLRERCLPPVAVGDVTALSLKGFDALEGVRFVADSRGPLKVWHFPDNGMSRWNNRYVVAVDIGGRSAASDFSVIAVIDRMGASGKPEIAAQWRGHIDHDLLTWRAASIAQWYDSALLVIESNTLETENTDGEHSLYMLSELNHVYPNLYRRPLLDSVRGGEELRVGFHTNRSTKSIVINHLIGVVRDDAYVERDVDACDELAVYECRQSGRFAAKPGHHDDILMTRAIGLYVASGMPEPVPRRRSSFPGHYVRII